MNRIQGNAPTPLSCNPVYPVQDSRSLFGGYPWQSHEGKKLILYNRLDIKINS